MYLTLMYCIVPLYLQCCDIMLKSGIYDFVICRGGTDMCFVLGFGRKRPDLKQYRISGLTIIKLDVVFGSKRNFAKQTLEFEVLDWQSQYHAILGRSAFAQFMAIPHYAYLQLKMPGSTGVLTVKGSFTKSDQCDRDFHKVFDTFGAQQELKEIAMATDRSIFPLASRSESKEYGRDFSIDIDTVTHQEHPTDPEKTVRVYAHGPEEQATALEAFLRG